MDVLIQLHLIMTHSANTDDGSCVAVVHYWMIDPSAPNYDASANTVDDGSCILPCASGIDSAHFESFETATVSSSQVLGHIGL